MPGIFSLYHLEEELERLCNPSGNASGRVLDVPNTTIARKLIKNVRFGFGKQRISGIGNNTRLRFQCHPDVHRWKIIVCRCL